MFTICRNFLRILPKISFSEAKSKGDMKYGRKLASLFATALEKKKLMAIYQHQAYCGVGFEFNNGKFNFCRVYDGFFEKELIIFDNKDIFIEWLASKNDLNMSGDDPNDSDLYEEDKFYRGNQRICRYHLEDFIKKTENDK